MRTRKMAPVAIGALGALTLLATGGTALADVATDQVEINVDITDLGPTGALTMSVAASSMSLTEIESGDPDVRQFDGTLPTVTVSDDRSQLPDSAYWYVTGQSSAFTAAGLDPIGAGHLGWSPQVLTQDDNVIPGDEVDTVLDAPPNNVGLVAEELLALTLDSATAGNGTWDATADLFLKTPADVAPGSYTATLTLTLWEDTY